MINRLFENLILKKSVHSGVDGDRCFDIGVLDNLLNAPYDIAPNFIGPPGSKLRGGRGKDHPRYGRFIYAFAEYYKPQSIVEVGTYAGGTAVCWAEAMKNIPGSQLICIDNDTYSKGTYPEITKQNLDNTGLSQVRYALMNGDSKELLPDFAKKLEKTVDIYLVDGDHTYEGAKADILNGFPMLRSGGFMLVHDLDRERIMDEATEEHPYPVYEAFMEFVGEHGFKFCILKYIRKHLGIIKIEY
ncbi:MAG: class I SAM-dependent methyltransferase [bacterium]|nr:class I SAM-dependent methyltransferase [bacterium]